VNNLSENGPLAAGCSETLDLEVGDPHA
jgi:hypothetical protein